VMVKSSLSRPRANGILGKFLLLIVAGLRWEINFWIIILLTATLEPSALGIILGSDSRWSAGAVGDARVFFGQDSGFFLIF
jgi:hypothetical protein